MSMRKHSNSHSAASVVAQPDLTAAQRQRAESLRSQSDLVLTSRDEFAVDAEKVNVSNLGSTKFATSDVQQEPVKGARKRDKIIGVMTRLPGIKKKRPVTVGSTTPHEEGPALSAHEHEHNPFTWPGREEGSVPASAKDRQEGMRLEPDNGSSQASGLLTDRSPTLTEDGFVRLPTPPGQRPEQRMKESRCSKGASLKGRLTDGWTAGMSLDGALSEGQQAGLEMSADDASRSVDLREWEALLQRYRETEQRMEEAGLELDQLMTSLTRDQATALEGLRVKQRQLDTVQQLLGERLEALRESVDKSARGMDELRLRAVGQEAKLAEAVKKIEEMAEQRHWGAQGRLTWTLVSSTLAGVAAVMGLGLQGAEVAADALARHTHVESSAGRWCHEQALELQQYAKEQTLVLKGLWQLQLDDERPPGPSGEPTQRIDTAEMLKRRREQRGTDCLYFLLLLLVMLVLFVQIRGL